MASLCGLKMLVASGDASTSMSITDDYKHQGAHVVHANDGYETLVRVVDIQPDLIILDAKLQKLDCYQTCALIKHNRVFKNIPVMLLENNRHTINEVKAKIVGANGVINRKTGSVELDRMINQELHDSRMSIWPLQRNA